MAFPERNIGGLASEEELNDQALNVVPQETTAADNWMPGFAFDQSKLPANFDWQNYLTRYADLAAAGIDTPLEAQRHYALYGSTEGRQFAPEVVNQDAVKALYQSILGREADPGGLAYWASQFGADVSPEEEAAFRQAAQAEIAARTPAGGLSTLDKSAAIANLPEETEAVTGVKPRTTDDFRASTSFAENYLMGVDPNIQQAFFKPGSTDRYTGTFVNTYKLVDGKMVPIEAGPEDIASGNVVFLVGGAPSGDYAGQDRVSQAYMMKDGQLTKVGSPQSYKAPEDTPFFRDFLITGVLPMALAAAGGLGLTEALGGALSGGALAGSSAAALGGGALNFTTQLLAGRDPLDALKGSVLSAGAGLAANQIGSMLPTEIATVGKQALTQLITTGKINPLALATSAGLAYASDTLAAETGLDKATAGKLVNAGYQLFQGNELGALSTLAQAGISSTLSGSGSQTRPQDQAAFLDANASPLGVGALSPIPAEDEQIAQQQRVIAANQAISDYLGPGNDLSREGLVSQLQSLGFSPADSENYAKQADAQINQQRVGADVMNRYSRIDPEFGTPALDRQAAVTEMVAAGFSDARANELLNGIDAQNAIKLENKLSVQSAYRDFIAGTGTEDQLRSALTSAGYNDAAINDLVTKGRGIIEGQKLTAGEGAQELAATLPDIRAEIAAKPTFSEAYATAREKLGAGATFTWQGKTYVASSAEERPDLTAAGMAAKAMQGDPQFQVALSETALQNQRGISQVLSDYSQKGGDLTRESAIDRLEKLGVTKDQASFFLDQKDGKIPYTFDQFKSAVPTADADAYRAYVVAFNELKNKGVPTSLIDISGYAASGARPNMPALINGISTAFGMGAEAAGNTLKAFGTMGEALGFDTAKMSDFGRKLENIAQEMYPQALINSENQVQARFASATNAKELGMAIVDSVINNPGAVLKMVGVEGIQEIPNIVLALSTGGAYGAVRYAGLLAGLGLDVIESAGLQGAQKVEEGLAKGLSRAAAVKGAVDDMKTAGAVTALMTAAADKVPFGGTIAKTLIKGSASEGAEEYVIARATGADHMSALRQAAFGAMIGGPTEASLQGAGNLTSVVINGDAMVGTYADGTKVTITEPSGATELKIDVTTPSVVASNVTSTLTSDLTSGVDLNTAINNVVTVNAGSDLSGTIDSTVKVLVDNNVDLTQGVSNLTSAAASTTGDTTTVVNQVVSSLASNNVDLNANAGSVVAGALSSGSSVTTAVTDTLAAITNNGGTANGAATSIIDAVSNQTGGDASAVTSAGSTIIASSNGDKTTVTTVITAAANATNGSIEVVGNLVSDAAKTGNSDTTAAAVDAAITSTNGAATEVAIGSALNNGADANTVLSTATNTLVATGGDASAAVTSVVNAGLSNNVDTGTAVSSAVTGAVAGGGDTTTVVNAAVSSAVTSAARTKDYSAYSNMFADKQAATSAQRSDLEAKFAASSEAADAATRTFNGTVYPTVEARNAAMNAFYSGTEPASTGPTTKTSVDTNNQVANLSDVISLLSKMGITPTNSMVADLTANNATNAQVIQNLQNNAEIKAIMDGRVASQVTAAVDSAVSSAITAGGNTKAAVGGAIDGAVNAGANINDATSASVSATIISSVTSGGDTNTSITDAVSGAVSNDAASNLGGNTTLLAAADSALSMASVTNLDTNQVVTSVINGAVNGGVDTATAISSTVVTAVNQGNDPNTIVQAVTSSNPTASVDVDTTGTSTTVTTQNDNVTSSVTIDNTSGVTTTVNVDGNTNTATVIEVDASSGTTTQTTITPDGNVTTNTNLHVVPPDLTTTDQSTERPGSYPEPTTTSTPTGTTVTTPEVTAPTVTPPTVTTPETKTTTPKTTTPSPSAGAGMLAAASLSGRKSPEDWLGGKLLQSKELGKYYDPLAGVFDTRLPVVPETPVQEEEMRLPYYTYGQEPSMDEIFGEIPVGVEEEEPVYRMGGQVMNPQFMYAKGGLPRQDFRDGKHVAGPGDGQSDDIPAMLADGEFVFPADVVAALGNGSTKAGTEKLYEMMHAIRQRARSNKPKDLPPPALKSPLDYLKKR